MLANLPYNLVLDLASESKVIFFILNLFTASNNPLATILITLKESPVPDISVDGIVPVIVSPDLSKVTSFINANWNS